MKIGLLFGSFNPIHIGHLAIAEYFTTHGGMEEVWLMVSPQNPFKKEDELAPPADRLEMVRIATQRNKKLLVSNLEFTLPLPSYTIDSLRHLTAHFPDKEFYLLMGEDLLSGLNGWKEFEEIVKNYQILVYPRRTTDKASSNTFAFQKMDAPRFDISSTYIRKNIQLGFSVRYLLPDEVISYIIQKNIYR